MTRPASTCPFCDQSQLEPQVVTETKDFSLVADRYPLRDGHLLVVPRQHLACYGTLPEQQEAEFLTLKAQAADFLSRVYGPPLFFEHGVAGQTVGHAHLHAVPGAPSLLRRISPGRELQRVSGLAEVRGWYTARGPYIYYEEAGQALLLSPGHISPGYLQTTMDALQREIGVVSRPDGESTARSVRGEWQQHRAAIGHGEMEVVACFLRREGRICLFKRSQRVGSARGKWHVVSGYLPSGADPVGHAFAELSQETGLEPGQVALIRAGAPLENLDPSRGRRWRIHPFLFQVLEGEPVLNWEHVDLAWVYPEEMGSYDCVPWLPDLYWSLEGG